MGRRRVFLGGMIGVVFLLSAVTPVRATSIPEFLKEKGIEAAVTAQVDFYSKYIWRGMRFDNDPVLQPSMTVAVGDFSVNVWGNYDAVAQDELRSDEVDTTVSYGHTVEGLTLGGIALKPVTVTVGNTYYECFGADTFSSEVFAEISYGSFLSPTLAYYYDYIDESHGGADGNYVKLSVSQSFPFVKDTGITFDTEAAVGYNDGEYIDGIGGDCLLKAGLTFPIGEKMTFSPSINYSRPFSDVKSEEDGDYDTYVYYGAMFTVTF